MPVKAVNKNVPKMDHVSLGEIAAAEADPSNFSGVTSANHAAMLDWGWWLRDARRMGR